MPKQPKYFFSETWKMNYNFCVGWSEKDFTEFMLSTFDYQVVDLNNDNGRCIECQQGNIVTIVIWTRAKSCASILVHECIHATNCTLKRAQWTMDFRNDEPHAYLAEAIYRNAIGKVK